MVAALRKLLPSAGVCWGLLLSALWAAAGIALWHSPSLQRARLFWLDQLFAARHALNASPQPHAAVVIVGIDDRSRKQMRSRLAGADASSDRPLDDRTVLRHVLAQLLTRLTKARARTVAVDYLMDVPSSAEADQAVVAALGGGDRGGGIDAVLASLLTLRERKRPIDALRQWGVEGNVAILSDADGKFRRCFTGYVVRETPKGLAPARGGEDLNAEGADAIPLFAVQACRVFCGQADEAGSRLGTPWTRYRPDQTIEMRGCPPVPPSVLIDFVGPAQTFETLGRQFSAIDVIDGKAPLEKLRDKLVMVGPALRFQDRFTVSLNPTPDDAEYRRHLVRVYGQEVESLLAQGAEIKRSQAMAGIEIHANLASQILQGRYLRELSQEQPVLSQVLIALPLLGLGWVFWRLPASSSRAHVVLTVVGQSALLLLVAGGAVAASVALFSSAGWVFLPLELLIAWTAQALCGLTWTGFQLRRRNRRIEQMFGSAVGEELLEYVRRHPQLLTRQRKLVATVLFADIRGFTPLTEALGADQIIQLLREHFEAMWEPLSRTGAWVDKYVGDLIMAAWNVLQPMEDHALRGVRAAIGMKRALAGLNARRREQGQAEIAIGIGLHTGELVSGNVGSQKRHNYTIIGQTVNLASRIEGQAKGAEILISQATYDLVKDRAAAREWKTVTLRGSSTPMTLYEVIVE